MDRINLDVCGQLYAVPKEIIENGPRSRLTQMYMHGSSEFNSDCIVINRPPEYFTAILAFYQTGELHIPITSCPVAFLCELEYWEISPDVISGCCYNRLQRFLDEQDTLNTFKDKCQGTSGGEKLPASASNNCFQKIRAKIWEIIDYTKPSIAGKIYLFVTFLMVLLSIFVLAYSSDHSFQRTMTNCERLEYMDYFDVEGFELIKPYLEELCTESNFPAYSRNLSMRLNRSDIFNLIDRESEGRDDGYKTYLFFLFREVIAELNTDNQPELKMDNQPELNTDNQPTEELHTFYDDSSDWLAEENAINITFAAEERDILLNRNGSELEVKFGNPHLNKVPLLLAQTLSLEIKNVTVPNLKIKMFILSILEGSTTIYFTVEILLRLFTCPNIKLYFLSIINCSDALSLLGAYLYFILYLLYPHLRYGSWIDYVSYLQMFRSLRLFRIVLNMRAGTVLAYTVRKNIKDLSILVLFLFVGMCTFASCIYIAEDNPNIKSIPDAWYLSVITMTTVGYGDIQPQTKIGRFLCCLCAVAGVLLLALTVPIFANHFLILYNQLESENVVEKFQRKKRKLKDSTQKKKMNNTTENGHEVQKV